MKIFRCTNPDCTNSIPGTVKTNNVRGTITLSVPVDDNGIILNDFDDATIVERSYICGACGNLVEEVAPWAFVKLRVTKRTEGWLLGEYCNILRDASKILNFAYHIKTREVRVKETIEGYIPWDVELEYIREHCFEQYVKHAIVIEIIDCRKEGIEKVYEVVVKNLEENITFSVEATATRIVSEYGPRPLETAEKEKILKTIEETHF